MQSDQCSDDVSSIAVDDPLGINEQILRHGAIASHDIFQAIGFIQRVTSEEHAENTCIQKKVDDLSDPIQYRVTSIRRGWASRHRLRWPITVLNGAVIVLVTVLVVRDLGRL